MLLSERGRELGVNQDVVRERGKDIWVQLIYPPAPPASLTIFLDPRPFHPSDSNPEAHQHNIKHMQCFRHSPSATDAAMAAELPLFIDTIQQKNNVIVVWSGFRGNHRNRKSNNRKLLTGYLTFDCAIDHYYRTLGGGVVAIGVGHCFDDFFDVIDVGST